MESNNNQPVRPCEASRFRDRTYVVRRRKRYWEVVDPHGELVCLTVYKRGALEVTRRLALHP